MTSDEALAKIRPLTSLEGLSGLAAVSSLNLSGCEQLTSLEGLSGLTALTSLNLSGCTQLTEFAPACLLLVHLRELYLHGCSFVDLDRAFCNRNDNVRDEVYAAKQPVLALCNRYFEMRAQGQYPGVAEICGPRTELIPEVKRLVTLAKKANPIKEIPYKCFRPSAALGTLAFGKNAFDDLFGDVVEQVVANLAHGAGARGQTHLPISEGDQFTDLVIQRLLESLPINPVNAYSVFGQLAREMRQGVPLGQFHGPWGRLLDQPSGLVIEAVPIKQEVADRPRARFIETKARKAR